MSAKESLKRHLESLLREIGSLKHFYETVELVIRLHKNIQFNRGAEGYRRLIFTSSYEFLHIWQFESIRRFFYELGWSHVDDALVCRTCKNIELALEVLKEFSEQLIELERGAALKRSGRKSRKGEKVIKKKDDFSVKATTKNKSVLNSKPKTIDLLSKKQQYWIDKTYFVPIPASEYSRKHNKPLHLRLHLLDRLMWSDHPIVVPIPIVASPTLHLVGNNKFHEIRADRLRRWSSTSWNDPPSRFVPVKPSSASSILGSSVPSSILSSSLVSSSASTSRSESSVLSSTIMSNASLCSGPVASGGGQMSTAINVVTGLCNKAANSVTRLEQCFQKMNLIPVVPLPSLPIRQSPVRYLLPSHCNSINMVSELEKSSVSIISVSPVSRPIPEVVPAKPETSTSSTWTLTAVNVVSDLCVSTVNLVISGLEQSTKNILSKFSSIPAHYKRCTSSNINSNGPEPHKNISSSQLRAFNEQVDTSLPAVRHTKSE